MEQIHLCGRYRPFRCPDSLHLDLARCIGTALKGELDGAYSLISSALESPARTLMGTHLTTMAFFGWGCSRGLGQGRRQSNDINNNWKPLDSRTQSPLDGLDQVDRILYRLEGADASCSLGVRTHGVTQQESGAAGNNETQELQNSLSGLDNLQRLFNAGTRQTTAAAGNVHTLVAALTAAGNRPKLHQPRSQVLCQSWLILSP